MLHSFSLLLPALIPSWRFFDTITASPRIEFALLKTADEVADEWQEFRPRPAHLTLASRLKRLFWNPRWNESLFLVSCAERLMENPTQHSLQEIKNRIQAECHRHKIDTTATPCFQFRLVFVERHDKHLRKHMTYLSAPHSFSDGANE